MKYAFGSSQGAADRLEDIARFFNPHSAVFLSHYVTGPVDSALDIGCGPGFTTAMLAGALRCSQVSGVDRSDEFLERARSRFPEYNFVEHDVTATPFPVHARVMYARFVLSHLRDAVAMVNRWLGELPSGGTLLVEELDGINTGISVFRRYQELNTAMVAAQGAELLVGRTLGAGKYSGEVVCNQGVSMPVSNGRAANWFHLNTAASWEQSDYIRQNTSAAERREITEDLARIRASGDPHEGITWTLRRLAVRRQ